MAGAGQGFLQSVGNSGTKQLGFGLQAFTTISDCMFYQSLRVQQYFHTLLKLCTNTSC